VRVLHQIKTKTFTAGFELLKLVLPGEECQNCTAGRVENQGYTEAGMTCRKCNGLAFK